MVSWVKYKFLEILSLNSAKYATQLQGSGLQNSLDTEKVGYVGLKTGLNYAQN